MKPPDCDTPISMPAPAADAANAAPVWASPGPIAGPGSHFPVPSPPNQHDVEANKWDIDAGDEENDAENDAENDGENDGELDEQEGDDEIEENDDEDNHDDNDDDVGLTVSEDESDGPVLGDEDRQLLLVLGQRHPDGPAGDEIAIASSSESGAEGGIPSGSDSESGFSDDSVEKEEEKAIQSEMRGRRTGSSISGSDLSDHASGSNSDDESSESSWDDTFLDILDEPSAPNASLSRFILYDSDNEDNDEDNGEDDDSALWEYFFTSSSNMSSEDEENGHSSHHKVKNVDDHGSGVAHAASGQNHEGHHYIDGQSGSPAAGSDDEPMQRPSGDSTDEDDGVPPERKRRRARGTRAVEVLGANSFSTRPPVLGSWNISSSKNHVGIIDGLTTRTLSPPPAPSPTPSEARNQGTPVPQRRRIFDTGLHSDSETGTPLLDKGEDMGDLGEFLNTDDFSDDANETYNDDDDLYQAPQNPLRHVYFHQQKVPSPFVYKNHAQNRLARNVPLSAFRTRQSAPTLFDSPMPMAKRGRRRSFGRETFMSPARGARRRLKRVKSGGASTRPVSRDGFDHTSSTSSDPSGAKDLIEELVEIGAISPFFP